MCVCTFSEFLILSAEFAISILQFGFYFNLQCCWWSVVSHFTHIVFIFISSSSTHFISFYHSVDIGVCQCQIIFFCSRNVHATFGQNSSFDPKHQKSYFHNAEQIIHIISSFRNECGKANMSNIECAICERLHAVEIASVS